MIITMIIVSLTMIQILSTIALMIIIIIIIIIPMHLG